MIKVYTTPTCPWCQAAKDFLRQKQLAFEEIDVSQNEEALNYIVEKTGQLGVPVIEIDNQFVVGFDKPKLEELLNNLPPNN